MRYRCPSDLFDSALVGCSKTFAQLGPDGEGFVDCPHCGLFFKPRPKDVIREPEPEPMTYAPEPEFLAYIDERLIPDLREGGWDATADDIERLRRIIEGLREEFLRLTSDA